MPTLASFSKIIFASLLVGLFSGVLSASFLHLLTFVTGAREASPGFIWGLPVFGLLLGLIIKKIPEHINQGVPYLLSELENKEAKISISMAPFVFFTALGTHLFGGSAGREGVGVIMGASIAQLLPKLHNAFKEMRMLLVYSGIAAGFSSIFGTPLTAIIFAFELHSFRHIKRYDLLLATTTAAAVAKLVSIYIGVPHHTLVVSYAFDHQLIFYVLGAGLAAGLGANFFYWGLKYYMRLSATLIPRVEYRLLVGGLMVSLLVFFTDAHAYIGIGTDMIDKSFHSPMSLYDFGMKCVLTVMTLAVGFKGGEVTPLFFMGATLNNALMTSLFNLKNYALSSALGMVGLFGAVTNTVFASSVMAMELFGPQIGVMAIFSCFLGKLLMGKRMVYRH